MKILITGGHVTPALAVIDELKKNSSNAIIFVGRKYALSGDKSTSFEYEEIQRKNIPFINLETGRLTRSLSLGSVIELVKIPLGMISAFSIILKQKPDRILSFGGYIGFPICLAGFLLRVPIAIHEQTIRPGLTNRIVGVVATKICVAFPEAAEKFSKKKTAITGNPIRSEIFSIIKKPFDISQKPDKPVIYVTGGSTGAHVLNVHIENVLEKLLKDFIIIHQTGSSHDYDDFSRLSKINDPNYYVSKHFSGSEIGYIYSVSDCVVGRSGANTIFELLALKKPSVLVPLPISAGGEQVAHAQLLQRYGVAQICRQDESSETLVSYIYAIVKNRDRYIKNFESIVKYSDRAAAEKIVRYLTA